MEAGNPLTQPAQSCRCVSCFVEFVDIYQIYDIYLHECSLHVF